MKYRDKDGILHDNVIIKGESAFESAQIGGYSKTEEEFYKDLSDLETKTSVDEKLDAVKSEFDEEIERLDEKIDTLEVGTKYKGKKCVHLGDSWVDLYGIAEASAEKLGYTVTNCGFQATSISPYNEYNYNGRYYSLYELSKSLATNNWDVQDNNPVSLYADRLNILKSVDWSEIDFCIFSYGVNDYGLQNPLGDISSIDEESVSSCLRQSIKWIQSLNNNMELIITTPCHRGIKVDSDKFVSLKKLDELEKYRNAIILVAKDLGIKVVDMFACSGINEGNKSITLLDDELHPTPLGITMWSDSFANAIQGGFVSGIDTTSVFHFENGDICEDNENLTVHLQYNSTYCFNGIKYLTTRRSQKYGLAILGKKKFESLPIGTTITFSGYGVRTGEANHRIGFKIYDNTLTNTLLDKYSEKLSSTTETYFTYSFTTTEEYSNCYVIPYVNNMDVPSVSRGLVRGCKVTVELP